MYNEGEFTERHVYDRSFRRVSTTFTYMDDTARGQPRENIASDTAVNHTEKLLYRTNHLTSTLFAVDKDGAVALHMMYDEWGNAQVDTDFNINKSGVSNLNNYTGYTYDDVLGIYYAQNRFYDAGTKRFIQEDPIKDGMNWYAYVGNNPINMIDPTGLAGQDARVGSRSRIEHKTAPPSQPPHEKTSPQVPKAAVQPAKPVAPTQKSTPSANHNKGSQQPKGADISLETVAIPYVASHATPVIADILFELFGISVSFLLLEEVLGSARSSRETLASRYPINAHAKVKTYYNRFECEDEGTNQEDFLQEFAETGSPNPEPPNNSLDEQIRKILEDAKLVRDKHRLRQYEKTGGYQQAKTDFESLKPQNVKTEANGTVVGELGDGIMANYRGQSNYGLPTLEIIMVVGKSIKIRYLG